MYVHPTSPHAELRDWQKEFQTWLEHENRKKLVNLSGGPWGKTWMVRRLQTLYPSTYAVYHSTLLNNEDAVDVDDFLTHTAKVDADFANGKTVIVVTIEALKTNDYKNDVAYFSLSHVEPEREASSRSMSE